MIGTRPFLALAGFLVFALQNVVGNNIVDIALSDDRFTTLVDLVVSAGLVEDLQNEDAQLTVFAPTNDAFAKLSPEILSYLSQNVDVLRSVLLYHVVPGEVFSSEITNGSSASTLLGAEVKFSFHWFWNRAHHWWSYGLFVNKKARVTQADVDASNGVIHVIDHVLIPPTGSTNPQSGSEGRSSDTIAQAVAGNEDLELLLTAVSAADLVDTLNGPGPFTVFAPVDSAFEALDADLLNDLLADPEGDLQNVLLYHVVGAELSSADIVLSGARGVRMLNHDIVGLNFDGDTLTLDDSTADTATVIAADIFLENGVVHLIDKVLIPPQSCPYKNRIWCWIYWH